MTLFTDFKRFNETHFWSVSRQVWLHQNDLQLDEYIDPDFLFFDEARNYHSGPVNESLIRQILGSIHHTLWCTRH